jgi:hypothetical protein
LLPPQAKDSLAVFVVNLGPSAVNITLQVGNATKSGVPAAPTVVLPWPSGVNTVSGRDLWSHTDMPGHFARGQELQIEGLQSHDSKFLLLAPASK